MAKSKYKVYGVYIADTLYKCLSWEDAKKLTEGVSGAIIKGCYTEEDYDTWATNLKRWRVPFTNQQTVAFVDGSVRIINGEPWPAYGVVIYDWDGTKYNRIAAGNGLLDPAAERNESGELRAAIKAASWAHKTNRKILIVYDYEGICSYMVGTWRAKSDLARMYVTTMNRYNDHLIGMYWIKGHTGKGDFLSTGNEEADSMAAKAYEGL